MAGTSPAMTPGISTATTPPLPRHCQHSEAIHRPATQSCTLSPPSRRRRTHTLAAPPRPPSPCTIRLRLSQAMTDDTPRRPLVMPGLVPGIHVLGPATKDVDAG